MNLSNENRFLLYCAETRIPKATLDHVKSLISLPLNWEEIIKSAFWHGIAPLVYHNLEWIEESQLIPQECMYQLKEAYYGSMARNMYLYAELSRILEAFYEKGVEVIVLKGAALAETVYGNIALRPMGDIDLLVKKEDLPYAERVMPELGYILRDNRPLEWYRENHHHIRYIHPEKDILFEIHWHIVKESHPSCIHINDIGIIERWWERAQTVEISGKNALMLCPGDLLFHLSLHFFKHRFMSPHGDFRSGFTSRGALIQICDIFQVFRHYGDEINWTRLKFEAERCGVSNLIYSTLYIVREFISNHDSISQDTVDEFKPEGFDKELMNLIQKRIFISEDALPRSFLQSMVADTFGEKTKILLEGIFPHPAVLSERYSIPLSSKKLYFYYLIRPFSLLLKHRKLTWKILRSNGEIKEEVLLNKWINSKN